MNINLSENIRAQRRARSLTQQQLADALGVTVGAVYKWEANLSMPDLTLLVELADLFDTSVDVLLSYDVKSNKQTDTVARLKEYLRNRDIDGLAEAEKALIRYPNCFDVVYEGAMLYYHFGFMSHNREQLQRSIELMERSISLLGQNTDPKISELSIYSDIARAFSSLGEEEKALEILKKNNARGVNNDIIGLSLAGICNRPDEAISYLSLALVDRLASLVRIVMGYMNVYIWKKDYVSCASILNLALDFFSGFKESGKSNLLDKPCANLYVCLAYTQLHLGQSDEARKSLRAAKELSEAFDKNPDYSADNVRYVLMGKRQTAFDDLGKTATESVLRSVRETDSEPLNKMWEEIAHEE